jgi:hypothetical protein
MSQESNIPSSTSVPITIEDLKYAPNAKHKEPWQCGRRGSLCPKDLNIKDTILLLQKESVLHGQARYAVHSGRAFKATANHQGIWHGWPVGWVEVPESLRQMWRNEDKLKKREMNRYWIAENLPDYL